MSIESVVPSSHLILCHPLLLLPPTTPRIRVFSNESSLRMRWPKYWSFPFSISPSNEYPKLISFRMDWLDLLAVQGTLKSLLQHNSSKASIFWHSAFFTVQLSHPYMTTGKTITLTRQTFFGKVMSLLFNMLSRLVITFLPRSKRLLISWLQPPSAVSVGMWIYIWAFYFVPLIYMSVFVPEPHCLDDCGFAVETEVRQVDSSSSILLCQDCFGYLRFFLYFHTNCEIICSSSLKNTVDKFIGMH